MRLKFSFILLILLSTLSIYSQQWKQNFKIVEPIRIKDNSFGFSVSTYNGFVAYGVDQAHIGSFENAGKVYIAKQDCNGWSIYQELELPETQNFCGFGTSVKMEGKTLAVYGCDPSNPTRGNALYIYERDINDFYVFTQKIVKPDNVLLDNFGVEVAISGNYMIVGALNNSTDNTFGNFLENAGAAYIYYRDADGVWSLVQKIVASDREKRDKFGCSVAIYENTIVVGAVEEGRNWAGAAYIFEKNTNSNKWSEVKKLVAYDFRGLQDGFGGSVAILENTIMVSAGNDDDYDSDLSGDGGGPLTSLGSVYIFKKNSNRDWVGHQKIRASDGSANNFGFGGHLRVYDDKMATTGTEYVYDNSGNLSKVYGRVYMFQKDSNDKWSEYQIVESNIKHNSDWFGGAISLYDKDLFVSAFWETLDSNEQNYLGYAGAVYVFNNYDYIQIKKPVLNSLPTLLSCADLGNGFSSGFDMSTIEKDLVENSNDFVFSYKDQLGNNLSSPLPIKYSNKYPYSEIINIRVGNKNNLNCYEDTKIELQTLPSFDLNKIEELHVCDVNNSGYGIFDLSGISSSLVNAPSLYNFLYFDSNGKDISALINRSYKNVNKGYEEITVEVTDINNFCSVKTKIFLTVSNTNKDCLKENNDYNIPVFFTPNGDGINDFWEVTGIENQKYSIYIYDRYGKLLKTLGHNSGWDGNLNGNPLPSSDYWFRIIFEDGTNKNGHFSLKR
ncbi:hypothetical protein OA88_02205 [Flavobacterium sp. JRM]|nr:hypothetical protein OA88_02205 [Flavobacterium sp. JRM]